MMFNGYFEQKTVWITGASSGIGAGLVKALAKTTAYLILSSRRKEALEQVAAANSLMTDNYLLIPLDLENYEDLGQIANSVLAHVAKIDVLIHCGGVSQRSLAVETSVEVDRKIMAVDYLGTVALTKGVLPAMLEAKSGQIAVVTSMMGLFSSPKRSAYCAAKHALHGFFESLRAEVYEQGVRITMLCPGFVQTDVSIHALTGSGATYGRMDPKTADGVPVDVCAQKMLKAISKQQPEVYIGGWELRGVYVKRFFPALFRKLIRKAQVQ